MGRFRYYSDLLLFGTSPEPAPAPFWRWIQAPKPIETAQQRDDRLIRAQPWWPVTDPIDLKHLGKNVEELGELVSIMGRIITQGFDGVDPKSGKVNTEALEEEMADVMCKIQAMAERKGLDWDRIERRMAKKTAFHADWFTWDRPEQHG